MSDPWLKFYPSDWRADPALRMCSIGARGLWMEMLCVMHEAEPRGTLRVNGKALSDRQLASLAGTSVDEVTEILAELEGAGVFSRDEDGTIMSRRMMRDDAKAKGDKANGKKGGNPTLKEGVNPTVKPEDKAQKPEARSQTEKEEPAGSSKKRGERIPEDFKPDIEWAQAQGLSSSEADVEAAQFIDFWHAKVGKDSMKLDWPRTWHVWVRNFIKNGRRSTAPPRQQQRLMDDLGTYLERKRNGERNGGEGNREDAQRLPPDGRQLSLAAGYVRT